MTVNNHMFSKVEAEQFVNDLYTNINLKKRSDFISKYFSPDVIGHYQDECFYFDDLYSRLNNIGDNLSDYHFHIGSLYIIDNFITFWLQENWFSQANGHLHESKVAIILRIKNSLICEYWILSDWKISSYQKMNDNFQEETRVFEIAKKVKHDFFAHLAISEKAATDSFDLSEVDRECLYYYFHGYSAKETAVQMNLSFRTVQAYIGQLKQRFNCTTKAQLRKRLFAKVVD